MSTAAERAAFNLSVELADCVRTHYAPAPTDRRGSNLTRQEAVARARNGRKAGPKAPRRKRIFHFPSDYDW